MFITLLVTNIHTYNKEQGSVFNIVKCSGVYLYILYILWYILNTKVCFKC